MVLLPFEQQEHSLVDEKNIAIWGILLQREAHNMLVLWLPTAQLCECIPGQVLDSQLPLWLGTCTAFCLIEGRVQNQCWFLYNFFSSKT